MKRYFLHGDEDPAEPGTYFCRGCDAFAPAAHFLRDAHALSNSEHLARGLRALAWLRRAGSGYHRPAGTTTVFSVLCAEQDRRFLGSRALGARPGIRPAPAPEPPKAA